MIKISILYPNRKGNRFDMNYYLNIHMPMSIVGWVWGQVLQSHSALLLSERCGNARPDSTNLLLTYLTLLTTEEKLPPSTRKLQRERTASS